MLHRTPLIAVFSHMLYPAAIIATLVGCMWFADEAFDGYYLILTLMTFFISVSVFERVDLYRTWNFASFVSHFISLLLKWSIVAAGLSVIGYTSGLTYIFKIPVILTWFIATPLVLIVMHYFLYILVRSAQSHKQASNVLIVGANELGVKLADQIRSDPYLLMNVTGYFDDRSQTRTRESERSLVLGRIDELANYVRKHPVHQIYITLPMSAQPRIIRLLESLQDTTASIYFVPDIYIFNLIQAQILEINGIPVMAICETPFTGMTSTIKRIEDIVLSLLILVLCFPLMLLTALAVKLTSPGPVLFKQRRYGLDGEEILVYKFRSMKVCEDGDHVPQARKNDQRLTPIGHFLRSTSLDEMPQFINVLQGRMSIVGPRPHAVAHNELYRELIRGYMIRHKVKPGITGWAQVNGYRGETEVVEKMQKRIEHDLEYLRNWSIGLDLWIVAKTVLIVLKRGAY